MATATQKTFVCKITRQGESFTVTSPGGSKSLTFNASVARKAGVTLHQLDLISRLGAVASGNSLALTMIDMQELVKIRDKCKDVPARNGTTDKPALNGAAAEVAARTLNKTEAGVERREAARDSRGLRDAVDVAQAKVERLNKMSLSKEAMNMLIYDIPTDLSADCPNPSGLLWNYGFRLNKSCWVLPQSSLEARSVQELLAHWQEYEIEVHIIPYAEHALERIRKIAGKKLHDEVVRQHTSFIEKLGSASDRLEEARKELDSKREQGEQVTSRDYEKLEASRDNQVRATLKGAAKALEAAINCARHFDEEQNLADLFQGLREAIRSERDSFNALMDRKMSKRSTVQI